MKPPEIHETGGALVITRGHQGPEPQYLTLEEKIGWLRVIKWNSEWINSTTMGECRSTPGRVNNGFQTISSHGRSLDVAQGTVSIGVGLECWEKNCMYIDAARVVSYGGGGSDVCNNSSRFKERRKMETTPPSPLLEGPLWHRKT